MRYFSRICAHARSWREFAKCRFAHFPSFFSIHVDTYGTCMSYIFFAFILLPPLVENTYRTRYLSYLHNIITFDDVEWYAANNNITMTD